MSENNPCKEWSQEYIDQLPSLYEEQERNIPHCIIGLDLCILYAPRCYGNGYWATVKIYKDDSLRHPPGIATGESAPAAILSAAMEGCGPETQGPKFWLDVARAIRYANTAVEYNGPKRPLLISEDLKTGKICVTLLKGLPPENIVFHEVEDFKESEALWDIYEDLMLSGERVTYPGCYHAVALGWANCLLKEAEYVNLS